MMSAQHLSERQRLSLLLSRRDWVYVLSLLLPVILYAIVLKIRLILAPRDASIVEALGIMQVRLPAADPPRLLDVLALLQSDLLFYLAYVALCVALFALARTGMFRILIVGLCHLLTACLAVITTTAYQYFRATGSTLDGETFFMGLGSLEDMRGLIASEIPVPLFLLLGVLLVYILIGPRIIAARVDRISRRPDLPPHPHDRPRWRITPVLLLVTAASALVFLSLLPVAGSANVSKSFARNPIMQVLVSAFATGPSRIAPQIVTGPPSALPSDARLLPRRATKQLNVVVIALESTRAAATTPYNNGLATTPFLADLAQRSLLVENAYAVVPHTHSALTAITCGINPPLDARGTGLLAVPNSIPHICLPHLLQKQGYRSVYFMSQTKEFENSQQIMENLGFEDFYSLDSMDATGFEPTNYFGVEDEVMLAPSRDWLKAHRNRPFFAMYLTSAPHHDYLAPSKRHGRIAFTDNDLVNRYLNSVRNQDFFLKQLFDQYRQLGLYDNTIFVLLGDHGQGFGEHGRNGHDNAIYEEGLRIPLLIHAPGRFMNGVRVAGPVSQVDILPTLVDLLGYTLGGKGYAGLSILQPWPPNRTLMFDCAGEEGCMASLTGTEKYIDHFDDRPPELFDLATDPAEQNNLADERPAELLNRRREALLAWRASVQALYGIDDSD